MVSGYYWTFAFHHVELHFFAFHKGLNKYTSKALGLFISAAFGGVVFTLAQGGLADILGSWRWTWSLAVGCELLMLFYARFGSRIRSKDIIN